ncbi:MAG: secondary thiamine-phosphate synthase enzyme YjbQ [Anaerolineales bacterium]|jgi:secondary thiamine-phosphate synthase enzyme
MQRFEVSTHQRDELIDITSQVQRVVDESGVKDGLAVVFVPHTTAGITINEHADPAVAKDIIYRLDKQIAWSDSGYRHREGNSASHIKASLMGSSVSVIVSAGRLDLGTWQGVFICEFDGPRRRNVHVKLISA